MSELNEQWRPVPEYEGLYEVSEYGQVRRAAKGPHTHIGKIIKQFPLRGYWRIQLFKDGKKRKHFIHHLVLRAFIGEPLPGQQCRHLDNQPSNNHISNLCWGTKLENESDRVRSGHTQRGAKQWNSALKENDVREIKKLLIQNIPQRLIAEQFGVTRSAIALIKIGKNWGWLDENPTRRVATDASKRVFDDEKVSEATNADFDANMGVLE